MKRETCALEEAVNRCLSIVHIPRRRIIRSMGEVRANLTGNIESDEIYNVLTKMYKKHTAPLIRQGKKIMEITPAHCKEHYTKHVVNPQQQLNDDVLYCCKLQRHYKKNIGVKSHQTGNVTLNPHHVNEYVKISKHKLGLGAVHEFNEEKNKCIGGNNE